MLSLVADRLRDARQLGLPAGMVGDAPLTFRTFERAYARTVASRFGPILAYVPPGAKARDALEVATAFLDFYEKERGTKPYAAQTEAILQIADGNDVLVNTPTGSGKSLVGAYVHFLAMCRGERSVYTAPTKALVNEKFFQLCGLFGARRVGIATGDATVNPDAPILVCTAEVLALMALGVRERDRFRRVVMDEFHYYDDKQRGMAWLVPLLELRGAQFVLLSATVGDAETLCKRLEGQTGHRTVLVQSLTRPVPLEFEYRTCVLRESLLQVRDGGLTPAYVVSFSKREASELARDPIRPLAVERKGDREKVEARHQAVLAERFDTPYGKQLRGLLREGVAVHHSGLLPRYRRVVERLTAAGHIQFVSGTDTLGVGVNLPIRTVLFTQLYKFDGVKSRLLDARDFHQLAGRAGRAGHDTVGTVWVQSPEHKEQARLDRAKKGRKAAPKNPPKGYVDWTEEGYESLRAQSAQPLRPRLRVDGKLVMAFLARGRDGERELRAFIDRAGLPGRDTAEAHAHADRILARLRDTASAAAGSTRAEALDEAPHYERPLLRWLQYALLSDQVDHRAPGFAMKVLSLVEAVLSDPSSVIRAKEWQVKRRQHAAEHAARFDPSHVPDEPTPDPAIVGPERALVESTYEAWLALNPWHDGEAPVPRGILREMYELQYGFDDYVGELGIQIDEGQLMKYLSEAYRIFAIALPALVRDVDDAELVAFKEWLYELVRTVDSSLVHEWERLYYAGETGVVDDEEPPPPPPVQRDSPAFRRQVRTAAFGWVRAVARRDAVALAGDDETLRLVMDGAIRTFFVEHPELRVDADARGPDHFEVDGEEVHQRLLDGDGACDWEVVGVVDDEASERAGRAVLRVTALRRVA